MSCSELELHALGRSTFLDDSADPPGCLFCALLYSPVAKGRIARLDAGAARAAAGVHLVLTAPDLPGENEIGLLLPDEPLLAPGRVTFAGQPVAAVYAESEREARSAAVLIALEIEAEPPLLDPREAYRSGEIIGVPRTFEIGDTESAFARSAFVVAGSVESGAQEHFYLEGQGAIALPREGGGLLVRSSTQSPASVQKFAARVCRLPMNEVEVDVVRLGGGFGGKEVQADQWAAFAALGTHLTGRPVKLRLRRSEDMRVTGKRHPYSSDYRISLDEQGKILAYEAFFYQNAGAAADLSPSILERSLFHATGSYFVPNVRVSGASCRTNLPPFTAFRGFGAPQAMLVIEAALYEAAKRMGVPVERLQRANLLAEGDLLPYGMKAEACHAAACWDRAVERYRTAERIAELSREPRGRYRQGYAFMPVCFGISFTSIALNQARALVHVYLDGSVGVSTGAVEMGQGVNRKIAAAAAATLGLPVERIRIETTNTTRVANSSPTAASTGADLNGRAAELACAQIRERLLAFAGTALGCRPQELRVERGELYAGGRDTGMSWEQLVSRAYGARVHLSAETHFATPDLHFDAATAKGHPFAYHVYGTAYLEATVDRLLGSYRIDRVGIVHDCVTAASRSIDLGQIEGGLLQGIGWVTMEEMRYDPKGVPLTATAGTYKAPDLFSTPELVEVEFLEGAAEPRALLGSKAVGEPPLMYGIGAYFALRKASEGGSSAACRLHRSPLTPEQIMSVITGGR